MFLPALQFPYEASGLFLYPEYPLLSDDFHSEEPWFFDFGKSPL